MGMSRFYCINFAKISHRIYVYISASVAQSINGKKSVHDRERFPSCKKHMSTGWSCCGDDDCNEAQVVAVAAL